jgi:hypothetical protein
MHRCERRRDDLRVLIWSGGDEYAGMVVESRHGGGWVVGVQFNRKLYHESGNMQDKLHCGSAMQRDEWGVIRD